MQQGIAEEVFMNNRSLNFTLSLLLLVLITSACAPSTPAAINVTRTPDLLDGKFDIGGYALHIVCNGQGSPTVLVEASFGDPGVESIHWTPIKEKIEATTRICFYDRAGLGSSDVALGENRTSRDVVQDLHTLLARANVPGPYILVAHSISGYHIRVFAGQYPDEVAGLVLIDSSHPDQLAQVIKLLPPESPDEPEVIKQFRIFPPASLPEKIDFYTSADQARAVKTLGDIPTVVLTHSPTWRSPDLAPDIADKVEKLWEDLQNDLASLSSNSTHIIATKAGHFIHVDEPQLVIDAILKLIDEAKK
jgi:pimeloyl-ACP methyl ester carboxylesterase